MNERAPEQLQRLGLDVSADAQGRHLRVAAQQQVEIAKALALNAQLLILDEPTAALGGEETELLFEQIRRLGARAVFIYIRHRLEEIARIADRIVVLRDGRVRRPPRQRRGAGPHGRRGDGRAQPRPHVPPARRTASGPQWSWRSRADRGDGSFRDISFAVRTGEIFGIAGIVGAGRTELVRAITGADPIAAGRSGSMARAGSLTGPADAIAAGVVLVPEDRKGQGLVLEQSIADNLALGNLDHVAPTGWVCRRRVERVRRRGHQRLGIKGRPASPPQALGRQPAEGGDRQMAVARRPRSSSSTSRRAASTSARAQRSTT